MIATQINKSGNRVGEFFGKLFQLRDEIHLNHLKVNGTGSYAQHVALGDFYDSLLDLTDNLIESYQGKYGIIEITIPSSSKSDSVKCIEELVKLTDGGNAWSIIIDTWSRNQLDEISTLCYKTLYKLKNLK